MDELVTYDGLRMSWADAHALTFDKLTFGVGYVKPTDVTDNDGERIYTRTPVSAMQGEWYAQFERTIGA